MQPTMETRVIPVTVCPRSIKDSNTSSNSAPMVSHGGELCQWSANPRLQPDIWKNFFELLAMEIHLDSFSSVLKLLQLIVEETVDRTATEFDLLLPNLDAKVGFLTMCKTYVPGLDAQAVALNFAVRYV